MDPATSALRTGGPDGYGYTFTDSNESGGPSFAWVDISSASATPGTSVALALSDDGSDVVTIPEFTFYGVPYTSLRVGANGAASFTASSITFSNVTIPNSATPNQLLAPFWDDLHMARPGAGSDVRTRDMGDGRFVISWINAKLYNPTSNTSDLDFQIILYANGDITYQYQTIFQGTATSTLASATTGIEGAGTGSGATALGLLVNFNAAGYLADGLAIKFTAPPPPTPDVAFGSAAMTTQQTGTIYGNGTSFWYASTNNIVITGANGTLPASSFTFDLSGSTSSADIAEARLYYTASSTTGPSLASPLFGTAVFNPGSSVTFTGTQALPAGNNYFWLVLRIATSATPGDTIQNLFTSVTVDGVVRTPSPTTLGSVLTLGSPPVNDNLAGAKVVSATPYSDSQTNAGATVQAGEAAATCAFNSQDGTNSIWYRYAPGTSGSMTATSGTFDTVLAVYTGTTFPLNQVGCADVQATGTETITLSVTGGTTYYVRVTGWGGTTGTATVTVDGPQPAGAASFIVSPATTQTLVPAGFCTSPQTGSVSFVATNVSAPSVTLSAAALTGGTGFSITGPTLPVTLPTGASATFIVTFTPTLGQTGAQATSLSIDYDDGTEQTAGPIAINATATDANTSVGSGAGYAFRNSTTVCTSGSMGADPAGTNFIDISGHTRISTWNSASSGDDSAFTLDATALDALIGSVRMFGKTYEAIHIGSNGYVSMVATSNVLSTLPTATGGGLIAAGARDYDFSAAYGTDNTGVAQAGVYYGLSDVDGIGEPELVVTWFHAHAFNSTVYPSATAAYVTQQLVIYKANRPNEDDSYEVRFLDGLDANSVPYRQNSAPIEANMAVGMSNPTGTASSEYREGGAGGPAYSSSLAVRFAPGSQATASAGAGWRMLGAPVAAYTVGRLADLNLVQSVTGQYPTFPDKNVISGYDGVTFVYPTNVTDVLTPGKGFFWYLFDIDLVPDGGLNGGGTSRSYILPMALQATGLATTADVTIPLVSVGEKVTMAANPYRENLNTSGAGAWTTDGALLSSVFQTWDGSSYINLIGAVANTWQGFWIESGTSTTLTIPAAARDLTNSGVFIGRERASPRVAFELAGTSLTGAPTIDRAATLEFSEGALPSWDQRDATKLAPMLGTYATIAFEGERDGAPWLKAQESRALETSSFEVPMVVDARGTSSSMILTWPSFEAIPADWSVSIRDMLTGETIDLRESSSYAFEVETSAAIDASNPTSLVARTTRGGQDKAGSAPRFVLSVQTRFVSNEGAVPTEFALAPASPNPIAGISRVRFALPEAGQVNVTLYDLLGRTVSTLADGDRAAGWHTADLDASGLSAGIYVIRMEAGSFVQTQRVTVVR